MKTFKKMILDDLKKQGLQTIAVKIKSIRYKSYTGGSSVDVDAVDLFKTEREQLETILNEYKKGHFDGMTDSYEFSERKSTKERTVYYVFLNNEFSQPVKNQIASLLKEQYGVDNDKNSMEKFGCWFDQAIWRKLQELEKGEL